ncbi:hypothetical protein p1B31 (plasmid) [Aromatoleum aromaticum EbN1]|uniref:Uncharacterized protein n=1 Tax=Aromatoleum aromaticum (strain DSM 19018 / LMG 30748 / EbN1) TaxID=76114 RepID=Q5NXE2_AROAE|nr:hypothetical protein p1B31 [Aromatoleum aromaticum EbN1]
MCWARSHSAVSSIGQSCSRPCRICRLRSWPPTTKSFASSTITPSSGWASAIPMRTCWQLPSFHRVPGSGRAIGASAAQLPGSGSLTNWPTEKRSPCNPRPLLPNSSIASAWHLVPTRSSSSTSIRLRRHTSITHSFQWQLLATHRYPPHSPRDGFRNSPSSTSFTSGLRWTRSRLGHWLRSAGSISNLALGATPNRSAPTCGR